MAVDLHPNTTTRHARHSDARSHDRALSSVGPEGGFAALATGGHQGVAQCRFCDGVTIWLTGLPSAGKTTLALALQNYLRAEGHSVEVLDGDVLRTRLTRGLGFSREDRDESVRRAGFVADLLSRNGVTAICALVSPYRDTRNEVRAVHGDRFVEVYVSTPTEVCAERDVKGLYAKQRQGLVKGLTGVDDPYEPPEAPEVVVPAHIQTVDASLRTILEAVAATAPTARPGEAPQAVKAPQRLQPARPLEDRRSLPAQRVERPGHFILSLDLELAWGVFAYGALETQRPYLERERDVIRQLLDLLDRYEIPATWATVGHLFLDSCSPTKGTLHPDVLRPFYPWYDDQDWHHLDPATDVTRDPLWYGPDIIDEIVGRPTPHEIGTHTFSHIVVGDPACTAETFRSQLRACRKVQEARGLPMRSIVYPNNRVGHLDVLAEEGVIAYRGNEANWYRKLRGPASRVCHLVDRTSAIAPPTYSTDDRVEGAVVNLPSSMFLLPRDGVRRAVPLASRRQQALRGLRRAAERREIFHLWFHPFNLATDPGLLDVLDQVFREAARLAERGEVVPITMGDLAERLLSAQPATATRSRLTA